MLVSDLLMKGLQGGLISTLMTSKAILYVHKTDLSFHFTHACVRLIDENSGDLSLGGSHQL